MSRFPITMRQPRHCRGSGWFYINPATIEVFVQSGKNCATLTRIQLMSALKVMNDFACETPGAPANHADKRRIG